MFGAIPYSRISVHTYLVYLEICCRLSGMTYYITGFGNTGGGGETLMTITSGRLLPAVGMRRVMKPA
jgi:hypothetical protein